MKLTKRLVSVAILLSLWLGSLAAVTNNPQSVKDLLNRIGGTGAADRFETVVDESLATNGKETFVITSQGGKPCIKGSTLSALTTGIGWYLNHHASINLTWNCPKVDLVSATLPVPTSEEKHTTDAVYRYYLNYTAFSYSMSTWTWDRWQEEIDWMALRGVNMPLQIVGLEEVWRRFLMEDYGYSLTEVSNFVAGPCYMAWFGMNNLEGWGGPNPEWWYKRQGQLGGQIVERMRSLGIEPVLPGFFMLPTNFQSKTGFKTAGTGGWCGFTRSHLADPSNTNFAEVAAKFYKRVEEVLGKSKYYSMDPFHEGGGANNVSSIAGVYQKCYEAMNAASAGSKWVIQSWQWGGTQRQSLSNVPEGRLIVLDLYADAKPAWGTYGNHDVVFSTIFNFGGRSGYFGRAKTVIDGYWNAKTSKATVKGIGASPEAIEQTPVMYDLLYELPWYSSKPDPDEWFASYAARRYGQQNEEADEAWSLILNSALDMKGADQGPHEALFCARPNLDGNKVSTWGYNNLFYDPDMIIEAAYKLLDSGLTGDNYSFDLTDMARQAMTDYARKLIPEIKAANNAGDKEKFAKTRDALLQLMLDIDELLNTNAEFMLGHWTQRARDMANEVSGTTDADRDWLELNNARQLISTWGAKGQADGGGLKDYSYREWGGMMKDYYYQRWKVWFDNNMQAPAIGWFQWEWNWAHNNPGKYPTEPIGDTQEVTARVLPKYLSAFNSNIAGGGTTYLPRLLTTDKKGKFFDFASLDSDYTPDLRISDAEISEIAVDFNKNDKYEEGECVKNASTFHVPADAPVGERPVRITLSDGTQFIYTLRVVVDITEDRTVSVKTSNASEGSVSIDGTNALSVTNKEIVVLRATPTQKYDFEYWTDKAGNNVGNDNPMSYYGTESEEFTAHFGPNIWGVPEYVGTNFPPSDLVTHGQYLVSLGVTQGGESTTFFNSEATPDEHFYYVTNRIKAAPGGAFHFDYKGKGNLQYNFLSAYCDLNADGKFDINTNELLGTKGTHLAQNTSVGQGGFDVLLPYDTPKGTTHIRLRFDGAWMDQEVPGSWVNLTDHPSGSTGAFKPDAKTNRVIYEVLLEINDGVEYNSTVTVKSNNENYGTVRSENMANVYLPGEKVILTAFPESGYQLARWEDNHGRTMPSEWMNGNMIEFTAFDDADITAVFERIPVEVDLWKLELETDENGLTYINKVVAEGESHLHLTDEHTGYTNLIDYIAPGVFAGSTALKELTLPDQEMHMTVLDEFYNSGVLNGKASKVQTVIKHADGSNATKENPCVRYNDPFVMTITGTYKGTSFDAEGTILFANGDNGKAASYANGWSKILLKKDGSLDVWWDSASPVNIPSKITSDFKVIVSWLGNKQTRFTVIDGEGNRVEKIITNSANMMQIWQYAAYIPAGMSETVVFGTPTTQTQIPGEALAGCRNLMDIHVPDGCTYAVEKNGVVYDKTGKNCIAYPEGRILGSAFSLVVPGSTNELAAAPRSTDGEMSNLAISAIPASENWNSLWTIDTDGALIHYNSGLGVDANGRSLSADDVNFTYALSYDEGEPSISFWREPGWYMTYQGLQGSPYSFDFYPVAELKAPAGNLRTVTFPVNVIVPDNAEVFSLDKVGTKGGYISHINPGHIIPAGTGVLIVGECDPFVITSQTSFETPDLLDGTNVELVLSTPYYILEGENFVRHESGTIPANRGYVPAGVMEVASFRYQPADYEPVEIDGWAFDWRYSYDENHICLTSIVNPGEAVLDLSKAIEETGDKVVDIDPAMFVGNTDLVEVTLPAQRLAHHYYDTEVTGAGIISDVLDLPQTMSCDKPWKLTIDGHSDGSSVNQWGSGLFATGTDALGTYYDNGFQLYLTKAGQVKVLYKNNNQGADHSIALSDVTVTGDFSLEFSYTVDKNAGTAGTTITVVANGKRQSKYFAGKLSPISTFCTALPVGINFTRLHLEGEEIYFPYNEGDLFRGCNKLQALHVADGCDYAVEKDGALYDKENPAMCIAYPLGRLHTTPFTMTCIDNVEVTANPVIDGDELTSNEVFVQNTDNPLNALWILADDNCLNHVNSGVHLNANGSGVGDAHNEYACSLVYGDGEPTLKFALDEDRYLSHIEGILLVEPEPHLFRFTPVTSFTAPVEEGMPQVVSFPRDVVVPQGANVKGISEVDQNYGGTLFDIEPGTVIPAGQPIMTLGGSSEFAFAPASESAPAPIDNALKGNVVALNSSEPFYLLEGNWFMRHESGVIPANSCYIPATEDMTSDGFPYEDISDSFEISFGSMPLIVIESETDILDVTLNNAPSYAKVVLTSKDETIAKVDEEGVVTGVAVGETEIVATCGKTSAVCPVFVHAAPEFYVTPAASVIRVGETVQLKSVINNVEGDVTVTYKSNNPAVATVDASGLVTAVAAGKTSVVATCGGMTYAVDITVNPPLQPSISVKVEDFSLTVGGTQRIEVTLTDMGTNPTVTYTSSNPDVATVDANGRVTAVGEGTAEITIACKGVEKTVSVTVNRELKPSISLKQTRVEVTVGETVQLEPTLTDMPDDAVITWSSGNIKVATVNSDGLVTTIAPGSVTITAICQGKSATCTIIVNRQLVPALTLSEPSVELTAGESVDVVATLVDMPEGATVTWTSDNESVATVDANGRITAVSEGTATVTAACQGLEATVSVKVNRELHPAISFVADIVDLVEGDEAQLEVELVDMGEDAEVVWTTSDEKVATVNASGVVTAVGEGKATISATCGGLTATCTVNVSAKQTVEPIDPVDPGEDGINGVNADKADEIYSISGMRLNKPTKGYHILNGKKVFKKG